MYAIGIITLRIRKTRIDVVGDGWGIIRSRIPVVGHDDRKAARLATSVATRVDRDREPTREQFVVISRSFLEARQRCQ